MKNYERMAMQRTNGVPAATWRAAVADARKREDEHADAENWVDAPRDEGYNNN